MALVFKVKFQDTLRRWVVVENLDAASFTLTFKDLESKIRELFHLSSSTSLTITYVDKDNDVVTLANDQDLMDACTIQCLNPLRLNVTVLEKGSREHMHELPRSSDAPPSPDSVENLSIEALLSALPHVTSDAIKGFLHTYAPFIDPKLPAAACLGKVEGAFKEFVNGFGNRRPDHPKFGQKTPHPHPHPHPQHPRPHHHAGKRPWPPVAPGEITFHLGVQCDGCGMFPIEGSRYKSTKEINYDLCESCFKVIGNESDFIKLDRPAPPHDHHRHPCFRRGSKPFIAPPGSRPSFARGPYGWKPNHPPLAGHHLSCCSQGDEHKKLDARFVKDVTIFDGTELAPGAKFTKIWRMSNIGTLPWPQSSHLVHIGGDVLGTDKAVELELPDSGLPCGEEMEISIDLAAPEKAGRYVSHWRLSAPSGQKFGHRVWVVIQVVPQGEHSPQVQASLRDVDIKEVGKDVELQASLQDGKKFKEASDVDNAGANTRIADVDLDGQEKVLVDVVIDGSTGAVEQKPVEKGVSVGEDDNTVICYPDPSSFHVQEVQEKPKIEEDGFSLVEKPAEDWFDVSNHCVTNSEPLFTADRKKERGFEEVSHDSLLEALEARGFTDHSMNVSALKKHNFELEDTVNDFLVAAGWDGLLKDLEEMGFNDKHMNVRVLSKNKGSLKLAVKDLVKLEKEKN